MFDLAGGGSGGGSGSGGVKTTVWSPASGLRANKVAEFREKFASPYVAASRGFIDEIIRPRQTRAKLVAALASLETKRDKNPAKKHGNIPL